MTFTTLSRTYWDERLVDELVVRFTNMTKLDHILPGVKPTGKKVQVAFVVIVGIDGEKVSYEHIYWDQATVLVQLGLLDPKGLPVVGKESVEKLIDPSIPDPFFEES